MSCENSVLHSSGGKSLGWVCLDQMPSKMTSYLASSQAQQGETSCETKNKVENAFYVERPSYHTDGSSILVSSQSL